MRAEGEHVFIHCTPFGQGTGNAQPSVPLAFGARSMGVPNEPRLLACDAAPHLPNVSPPKPAPQAMRPRQSYQALALKANAAVLGAA